MRLSRTLIFAGILLSLAGILLWQMAPGMDLRLFEALRLGARDTDVAAFQGLSTLGGFAVLGPFALAIAAWLVARRRLREAAWLFATIGSGRLAVEAAKELLARPRPPLAGRLTEVSSQSFPSSHAAGTLLTFLALAMLFPRLRRGLMPFALLAAVAVGWSRIALGVHWPGDVAAGYGLALAWVGVAARWLPKAETFRPRS
jgi:undecaprenyl-diphosphatase